jgi:hypothetical protein
MEWYEIKLKDWDKLMESEREIFLTPIPGKVPQTTNSQRLSFAGTKQAVKNHSIKPLRKINSC